MSMTDDERITLVDSLQQTQDIIEAGAPGPFMGPIATSAYDLVLMTQVLPHLKFRPDEVIRTCREMLNPGGAMVVTALHGPCPGVVTTYGLDWRELPVYGTAEASPDMVTHLYTPDSLRDLLETAFSELRVWSCGGVIFGYCEKENRE